MKRQKKDQAEVQIGTILSGTNVSSRFSSPSNEQCLGSNFEPTPNEFHLPCEAPAASGGGSSCAQGPACATHQLTLLTIWDY